MTTTNDAVAPSTNDLSLATTQLAELSARANAAHQRVFKAAGEGLLAAFEAGQSLLQARKICLGHWSAWLSQNFKASARTAQRYMEFAEECHSIGGIDATRASRLPPQELGNLWSRILGRRGGRKSRGLPAASGSAAVARVSPPGAPATRDVVPTTITAPPPAPAVERIAAPPLERCDAPVDRMPPLIKLFAALLEGCRHVGMGDDCFDGEYADGLASKLEPHYGDLLDYMEYREEWRRKPGYSGVSSS